MKLSFNFLSIFTYLFSILFLGCDSSVEQEKVSVSSYELSQNENFVNIASEMKNYSQFIKETIEKSDLSLSEIENRIQLILNSGMSSDNQIEELSLLLNTDLSFRISENARIVRYNFEILSTKFDNIDETLLTESFGYILDKNEKKFAKSDGCGWRYYACLGAAYSAAVLCHAGCDTTALATTAGFGIPACVALCGSLQIFASVQCYDTYCSKNQPTKDSLQ